MPKHKTRMPSSGDYRRGGGLARICETARSRQSQEHKDAEALCDELFVAGCRTKLNNSELAEKLGFWKKTGRTAMELDMARFYKARNHAKDRRGMDGQPCCGFLLNYRGTVNGRDELILIDPRGSGGDLAHGAAEILKGWIVRERQHHAENNRMDRELEAFESALLNQSPPDIDGVRVVGRARFELTSNGTITPLTMGELEVWVGGAR